MFPISLGRFISSTTSRCISRLRDVILINLHHNIPYALLIVATNFARTNGYPLPSFSSFTPLQYIYHFIWIHFRTMGGRSYLVFCSIVGGSLCLRHIAQLFPRMHYSLAFTYPYNQAGYTSNREATKVTLHGPLGPLPL